MYRVFHIGETQPSLSEADRAEHLALTQNVMRETDKL